MALASSPLTSYMLVFGTALFFMFLNGVLILRRYVRCPANRILVISGRVGRERGFVCTHGGGKLVLPIIQGYDFLSLEPERSEFALDEFHELIEPTTPKATMNYAISTEPELVQNAAARLVGLERDTIIGHAEDMARAELRTAFENHSPPEINDHRERFQAETREKINHKLAQIGMQVLNLDIPQLIIRSN